VLCAIPAAGCGGDRRQGSRAHAAARARARGAVPQADKDAYLAIARASGALRASVAAAAIGKATSLAHRQSVAYAAAVVRRLHPRDRELRALRVAVSAALEAALVAPRDPHGQRRAALAAIAATDKVNRGLRRYANRHPYVIGLIPD
jgi:hypothetical protein